MPRSLLFTITDFEIQMFRSGGPGGQHQNKRNTGARIIHKRSGARGESREHRSFLANKRAAFKRLAESDKFRVWIIMEAARQSIKIEHIDMKVREMMRPWNLKVEIVGPDGEWMEE